MRMNKNVLLAILVVIVMGLGGWIGYEKLQQARPSSSGAIQTGSNASAGKVLDFSHQNLTSVGANIYDQIDATQLILSYNSLRSLPSQLGGMDKLQVLRVDHNQLQGALIAEIRKMPLTALDASHNAMTGIPAEIGQLNQLQTLDFSYNKITTLPNELANLKQLKTLILTGNPLTASQIAQLKAELPNTTIVF